MFFFFLLWTLLKFNKKFHIAKGNFLTKPFCGWLGVWDSWQKLIFLSYEIWKLKYLLSIFLLVEVFGAYNIIVLSFFFLIDYV